jgi:hypothetical protein
MILATYISNSINKINIYKMFHFEESIRIIIFVLKNNRK